MSGIVCAIRGGPRSQKTVEKALELAETTGEPLYLLYVVNLDFLSHTSSSRVQTLSEDMREMGEFILATVQAKARQRGIPVHTVVRQGNVADEIIRLGKEVGAHYVIIGRPRREHEGNVFEETALSAFARRVRQELGAELIAVGEEDA
ncbi:MAG: universal stress protein [Chloroflexi bacterium]|nr:universal stress protein [Chloroflexota bacterium]